jgi:hypothetical protein
VKEPFCLLLIIVFTTSSLIAVRPANATIPKPHVPEFTVEFVDNSYDVATTYSIDPYTGENVTHPGYHVPHITLELTIENQPFAPYYEGIWEITLQYNIRIKGNYSEDWIELYSPSGWCPPQSDSENTVVSLGTLGGNGLSIDTNTRMIDVPSGSKVDFQVEAMIGYAHRVYNSSATDISELYPWVFTGESSGWSNTLTITIPASLAPSPSPAPSIEPTQSPEPQPEPFPTTLLIATSVTIAVVCVGSIVYFKKLRK